MLVYFQLAIRQKGFYMEYAGFWKRFLAMWLDVIILTPLILITYWGNEHFRLFHLYYFIPGTLFNIWFAVYLVKKYGGTPGKLIMKIKITKLDFSPVGYREAFLRNIVDIVFAILLSISSIVVVINMTNNLYFSMEFLERATYTENLRPNWAKIVSIIFQIWMWSEFIVMLTNKKRRAIHDFIAGTVVIRTDSKKTETEKFNTLIEDDNNNFKISFQANKNFDWETLKTELYNFYEKENFNNIILDKENSWMLKSDINKQAYINLLKINNIVTLEVYNTIKPDIETVNKIIEQNKQKCLQKIIIKEKINNFFNIKNIY